jgi:hypothetical protein
MRYKDPQTKTEAKTEGGKESVIGIRHVYHVRHLFRDLEERCKLFVSGMKNGVVSNEEVCKNTQIFRVLRATRV